MSPPCDVFARSIEDAWMALIGTPDGKARGLWLRPNASTPVGWSAVVTASRTACTGERWVLVGYYNRRAALSDVRDDVFHALEKEVRR